MNADAGTHRQGRAEKALQQTLCEILLTKPLDDVHVTKLCEQAGLSTMSFYAHYENKYDLAQQVVMDAAAEHAELLFSLASSQLQGVKGYDSRRFIRDSAIIFLEKVLRKPTLYNCIFQNRLIPNAIPAFAHHAAEILHARFEFTRHSMTSQAYYEDFIMEQSIIMLLNTTRYWSDRNFDLPPTELADVYCDFYFNRTIELHFSDERAQKIEVSIVEEK